MPLEIERKFLVKDAPFDDWPVPVKKAVIHQTYLETQEVGVAERVRAVTLDGETEPKCFHTVKRHLEVGTNEEEEREITFEEMWEKVKYGNPIGSIVKVRVSFEWQGHTFEIDTFLSPVTLQMMEVELDDMNEEVEFPPFVIRGREVTGEIEYTNAYIARKGET